MIEEFYESVLENGEEVYDIAISELNHTLQTLSTEEQIRVLSTEVTGYDVPKFLLIYTAGLTEYLCNKQGIAPPEWVFKPEYYFDKPFYPFGLEEVCAWLGNEEILRLSEENAIPEFKRRNFMISDVLDAV